LDPYPPFISISDHWASRFKYNTLGVFLSHPWIRGMPHGNSSLPSRSAPALFPRLFSRSRTCPAPGSSRRSHIIPWGGVLYRLALIPPLHSSFRNNLFGHSGAPEFYWDPMLSLLAQYPQVDLFRSWTAKNTSDAVERSSCHHGWKQVPVGDVAVPSSS
jgi:hypothetical protein